jgi:TRAP-type C4-dicarboxylate transport system permease large subunit
MQTCRQSRLKSVRTLGYLSWSTRGPGALYGALATAGRSLTFAALVLGLAVPRRYALRRLFNALVAPGARQSRWQSWLEVCSDTAVAIVMAIVLQRLCYGTAATWTKAGGVTVVLYTITIGRRYALRRVFEAWQARQVGLPLYTGR